MLTSKIQQAYQPQNNGKYIAQLEHCTAAIIDLWLIIVLFFNQRDIGKQNLDYVIGLRIYSVNVWHTTLEDTPKAAICFNDLYSIKRLDDINIIYV